MVERPNLFKWATSELSQDAFICWLLSWAEPGQEQLDSYLHDCALDLIGRLFEKHDKTPPRSIDSVRIYKQKYHIDVLCVINDKYPIIIEDKTGTKNHDDQLEDYKDAVSNNEPYPPENILPIYLKTYDQSDYSAIETAGYKVFLRSDFLSVLGKRSAGTVENAILTDFRDHLQGIEDAVNGWQVQPTKLADEWSWHSWVGFYKHLQELLGTGHWDYVANPGGGFLGFWWHFQGEGVCSQHLQLEYDQLCFKIRVKERAERAAQRKKWYDIIKPRAEEFGLKLKKPDKFGSGEFMTVLVLDGDYRSANGKNIIDLEQTRATLGKAEKLLEAVRDSQVLSSQE